MYKQIKKGECNMPVVRVEIGKLSSEQKVEIIKVFSEKLSEISGIPENFNTILISEYDDENIGVGSRSLKEIKKSR